MKSKAAIMSRLTPGQIQLLSLLADVAVDRWLAQPANQSDRNNESNNLRAVQLRQAERNLPQ